MFCNQNEANLVLKDLLGYLFCDLIAHTQYHNLFDGHHDFLDTGECWPHKQLIKHCDLKRF